MHPSDHRPITVRKAARCMSFSDDFVFPEHQPMTSVAQQMGNAVCRCLAKQLATAHDETSPNSGGHEELYFVARGRATFTLDGESFDAPAGTFVLVLPGERREAFAAESETTILVIGGTPGAALPTSPFEYWYSAQPYFAVGDYDRAIAIASEGLHDHANSAGLRYQLACYCAMSGRGDEAVEHLRRAFAADSRTREWAADDADLDPIRNRPDYPAASSDPM